MKPCIAIVGLVLACRTLQAEDFEIVAVGPSPAFTIGWSAPETGLVYTVERRSSLTAPWAPAPPAGQWPIDVSSWSDAEASTGAFQLILYRVRAEDPDAIPEGMVLIPGGRFLMGDPSGQGDSDELPVHEVTVSPFYIDRLEATNERVAQVLQWAYDQGKITATPETVRNNEGAAQELLDLDDPDCQVIFADGRFRVKAGKDSYPCVEVSWYGAQAYCNYRSDMEGTPRCVDFADWSCDFDQPGYRLPTEAEWEKASRGGLGSHHYPWPSFGGSYLDHIDASLANYGRAGGSPPKTTPVGYYDGDQIPVGDDMANGYGLYDMAGNVWEWTWDWYGAYPAEAQVDPTGPAVGTGRIPRGGAWDTPADKLRCSFRRSFSTPLFTWYTIGFRVAKACGTRPCRTPG